MVILRLNEAKSELEPVQDIQFLGLPLLLDQGRVSLPVSKAQGDRAHACRISSQKTLYTEVSHFMGSLNWASSTLEALTTTLSFIRSDKPVFNTTAFRPCSPCYPTQAVAGPIVSHIIDPYLTFPGGVHGHLWTFTEFHGRLDPGLGCQRGGFSDCGCMDPFQTRAPHQCSGAQGGNIGPPSLGYSITF